MEDSESDNSKEDLELRKDQANSTEVICIDSDEGSQDSPFDSGLIFEYPQDKNKSVHGSVQVHRKAVECLTSTQFLNDTIIDFWMKYVYMERLTAEDRENSLVFSSLFYKSLRSGEAVRDGWTRRLHPFDKQFIFIPIPEQAHWLLAVICFPGQVKPDNSHNKKRRSNPPRTPKAGLSKLSDTGSDGKGARRVLGEKRLQELNSGFHLEEDVQADTCTQQRRKRKLVREPVDMTPVILLFDSFRELLIDRKRIFEKLRLFLTFEWKKRNEDRPLVFNQNNLPGVIVRVPQQQNHYDCGIHILQCFEAFFQSPIQSFSIPFQSLKDWFGCKEIEEKRDEIFQTILQVLKEKYPDRLHLLPPDFLLQCEQELESEEEVRGSEDLFGDYSVEEEQLQGDSRNQTSGNSISASVDYETDESSNSSIIPEMEESTISPTPPTFIHYANYPSFSSDPYAADDDDSSWSSDSCDEYVALLTPETHLIVDEVIGLNDNNNDTQEVFHDPRRRRRNQPQFPSISKNSSTSVTSESESPPVPKEVMLLFSYPELEDF